MTLLPAGAQRPHRAADGARETCRTGQFAHVRQGAARQVTVPVVSAGVHRRNAAASSSTSACPNHIIVAMTKLLDEAVEAVRRLPSNDQDDIARAIMQLAGADLPAPVVLSPEEREAIARSKAAADRGEFATDEQVRAVWAKHGL
jgi:hypothetical protein